jgi:hypothetical protein
VPTNPLYPHLSGNTWIVAKIFQIRTQSLQAPLAMPKFIESSYLAEIKSDSEAGSLIGRVTVDKSSYHQLSQSEIGGDNPCSERVCYNNELPAPAGEFAAAAMETRRALRGGNNGRGEQPRNLQLMAASVSGGVVPLLGSKYEASARQRPIHSASPLVMSAWAC